MFFFFQAEDGIRDWSVTGVQTCALPIFAVLTLGFSPYLTHVESEKEPRIAFMASLIDPTGRPLKAKEATAKTGTAAAAPGTPNGGALIKVSSLATFAAEQLEVSCNDPLF